MIDVSPSLVRMFAQAMEPGIEVEAGCGDDAIQFDDIMLGRMASGKGPDNIIRLWTNSQCLVTTRRFAKRAEFDRASAASLAAGWPVYVRSTGGTTVVHRPGILNLSVLNRSNSLPFEIGHGYAALLTNINKGLEAFGLNAGFAAVEGSYCDGRHNIVVGGKKFAGTAGAIKISGRGNCSLAHASISIYGDLSDDIRAITRFETALGIPSSYEPASQTSLSELVTQTKTTGPNDKVSFCSAASLQSVGKVARSHALP